MPAWLERKARGRAARKGLRGKRHRAYVAGVMRNAGYWGGRRRRRRKGR